MAHATSWAGRATALIVVAVASLLIGLWAWKAEGVTTPTITLGSSQGLPATTGLAIPLTLANNGAAQMSSLSVDVAYDATKVVFRSAQAGAAAAQAAKQIASSTPAPGVARLVLFGMNQTAMGDGVLAQVTFDILGSAATGAAPLTLPALSASDAAGQAVVVAGQPGAIQVLGNVAPFVSAGADQTITLPATAPLDGTVTDDGLPVGSALTTTWSKVSGPGTVIFGNAGAVDTAATFSAAGSYVLRLTATDGALSNSDIITVTVNAAPVNQAPTVRITSPTTAGTLQTTLTALALRGAASDDLGVVRVVWMVTDAFGTRRGAGVALGTTAWSVASVPLQFGANTIRVTAVDADGRTAIATLVATRVPVAQAPIVRILRPLKGATIVSLTGVYADVRSLNAIVRGELYVDGRFVTRMVIDSSTSTAARLRSAIRPTDLGAVGPHVLEVRAVDSSNRIGTASITVTKP